MGFPRVERVPLFVVLVTITTILVSYNDQSLTYSITRPFPVSLNVVFFASESKLATVHKWKETNILASNLFIFLPYTRTNSIHEVDKSYAPEYKIVRTDFNEDRDLFAFSLSIYFEAQFVAFIDLTENWHFEQTWLSSLVNDEFDVIFGNGGHSVVLKQSIARRFLCYTDIKYSKEKTLSILYNYCKRQGLRISGSTPETSIIPNEFDCNTALSIDINNKQQARGFAAVIPTFRRDYLNKSLTKLKEQWQNPTRVFVVQNEMHVQFDLDASRPYFEWPVHHVWCTNWNSLFFMTYTFAMFLPEKFTLKMDDDFFPEAKNAFRDWIDDMAVNKNMAGLKSFRVKKLSCYPEVTSLKGKRGKYADHIGAVVMMWTVTGKLMHRFRPYTRVYAEDVLASMASNAECGIRSQKGHMWHSTEQTDGMTHTKTGEIARIQESKEFLLDQTYCQWVKAGYHPVRWHRFNRGALIDIRYPH